MFAGDIAIISPGLWRHQNWWRRALLTVSPRLCACGSKSPWIKEAEAEEKHKPVLQCLLSQACFVTGATIAGAKIVLHNGKLAVRGSNIASRNVDLGTKLAGMRIVYTG